MLRASASPAVLCPHLRPLAVSLSQLLLLLPPPPRHLSDLPTSECSVPPRLPVVFAVTSVLSPSPCRRFCCRFCRLVPLSWTSLRSSAPWLRVSRWSLP